MFVGIPNPFIVMPVEKLKITILEGKRAGKEITVLYNPEKYTQHRVLNVEKVKTFNGEAEEIQISSVNSENLSFSLFFDTMSAGAEIGGSMIDKAKFAAASLLPSAEKEDVRKYTSQITSLMDFDGSIHSVPSISLSWASLYFEGYLTSCTQNFTKFNEEGKPVRAILDCQFETREDLQKKAKKNPNESPDTTKYHMVTQGDSLWALAVKEYGQPEQWRAIAAANGLLNPRRLRTGERIVLPALD